MLRVEIKSIKGDPPKWQSEGFVTFDNGKLKFDGLAWLKDWQITINDGGPVKVDPAKEPEKWIRNLYREFHGRTVASEAK